MVVTLATLPWPDGSALPNLIDLPGRGVLPALRVPDRVKGSLAGGLALDGVMVIVVGVRLPTVNVTEEFEGA